MSNQIELEKVRNRIRVKFESHYLFILRSYRSNFYAKLDNTIKCKVFFTELLEL